MTEEVKQEVSKVAIIKQELRILKELRDLLKRNTKVGPTDAHKLAGVYQWLGAMITQSEAYIRDEKKSNGS